MFFRMLEKPNFFSIFPTFAAFRDEKILFLNRNAKKCVADVAAVVVGGVFYGLLLG